MAGIQTKVGLAIIGALVLGGGGTALAVTAAHGNLGFNQASPTAHSGDHEDDQDDVACTGTPTESAASPTAHSGDDSSHSSSATRTPGQDDREGSETECEKGDGTRTPEPTERPEGTRTPAATGTPGGN